jgi:hypothetical protein
VASRVRTNNLDDAKVTYYHCITSLFRGKNGFKFLKNISSVIGSDSYVAAFTNIRAVFFNLCNNFVSGISPSYHMSSK